MIYGILLAAGSSTRMGQPKQLLDWYGQPLVCYVARQALESALDGLVVVVGHAAVAVGQALHTSRLERTHAARLHVVEHPRYAAGQAGSLCMGLAALPPTVEAAMVLLVDQPLITSAFIDHLIAVYRQEQQRVPPAIPDLRAVVPCYQGRRGNPVLLVQKLFPQLHALAGDSGARGVLQAHAHQVYWLDVADEAVVVDIDTMDQYQALCQRQQGFPGDSS